MYSQPLPLRSLGASNGHWASRPLRGPPFRPVSPSHAPLLRSDQLALEDATSPTSPLDSAPKRPTSSSWEEAATSVQFAKSDVVKPSQAIIEILDVDVEEVHEATIEDAAEDVPVKEDEGRQMAQAMGAEKLYDVYQDMFPISDAPMSKLPELFERAGLTVTQEQLDAAIEALCPESNTIGSLPFKQCQEVYLHLQQQRLRADHQDEELAGTNRFARWLARLSDTEATNVLLVVVVTLCCISAFLAGGLAILLLLINTTSNVNSYLQENLGIVQDTVEVYSGQIAIQEGNDRAQMFVTTMASILENVAFSTTVNANTAQLSRVMISVAYSLGAWWNSDPGAFAEMTSMTTLLANASQSALGRGRTVSLVDGMNGRLPAGYEVLLGQWKAGGTSAVDFLTQFRFGSQCPNGTCTTDGVAAAAMNAGLSGKTGSTLGVDYRGAAAFSGYSSTEGLGVEVNLDFASLVTQRVQDILPILNAWTLDASNTWEFMLGCALTPGVRNLQTILPGCDAACAQKLMAVGMPLYRGMTGETGTTTYTNFRGIKSVVTYAPIPGVPCGLAIHMAYSDMVTITLTTATALVDNLNANFPLGSEEFELALFATKNNVTNFTHLSRYKYGTQCPAGQCVPAPEYARQAAANCSTGVLRTADYRGVPVLVGYACIREISAVLSFKLDLADVDADMLGAVVAAVDDRTGQDGDVPVEFLVAKPKAGLTAAQVQGYGDFEVVSRLKNPDECVNPNCAWNRESALRALKDLKDVVNTKDYRTTDVLAASSRSTATSYGIGLAVEQDRTEAYQHMIATIIKVAAFTGGVVACSTVVLILMTKLFLRSMIRAKEEGNQVVVVEKERFSKLVSSMYPKFVLPQLLEGDKQLVCEVPGAAVFFSDIHEFTSASNTMGSEELLRLMGYVYGVMDYIGDSLGVYKVKTIGDAYLAVRGLPGSDSENPSLELLRYASFVLQVFGDRFVHPTEGQVLAIMNKAMVWNGGAASQQQHRSSKSKGKGKKGMATDGSSRPSVAPSGVPSSRHSKQSMASAVLTETKEEDRVQCVMSYGLAVGKIVAGVLAGRCPMFDIWGATVNLASRMQSSGEPGRIQVSEQLYKKVLAVPGQPFTFEAPRSTFCKGFGNVSAYMVRTTTEGVPKDLQEQLRLEPRFNAFRFDNILTAVAQRGTEVPSAGPVALALPKAHTIPNIVLTDSEEE